MRRRLLVAGTVLLLGAGGVACNGGGKTSETPNQVSSQPGAPCHGKKCHPNPGPTPSNKESGGGDGNVNE